MNLLNEQREERKINLVIVFHFKHVRSHLSYFLTNSSCITLSLVTIFCISVHTFFFSTIFLIQTMKLLSPLSISLGAYLANVTKKKRKKRRKVTSRTRQSERTALTRFPSMNSS
jgi:hypothetical protein